MDGRRSKGSTSTATNGFSWREGGSAWVKAGRGTGRSRIALPGFDSTSPTLRTLTGRSTSANRPPGLRCRSAHGSRATSRTRGSAREECLPFGERRRRVAVERRSYPRAAEEARKLPLSEDVRNALGGAGRAVVANLVALPLALVLVFTGVGPALVFWAVNAWLIGRELVDMVWQRHRPSRDVAAPVPRLEQFLLGGAIVALLAVPLVNFLAPVLGAAAATHLVHGRRRLAHA